MTIAKRRMAAVPITGSFQELDDDDGVVVVGGRVVVVAMILCQV